MPIVENGTRLTTGAQEFGMKPQAEAVSLADGRSRAQDFVALAKPRLNVLVVASALAGYAMAGGDPGEGGRLVWLLLGTALVAGGASAFNQIVERAPDALMRRTRRRPLPDGRLDHGEATAFAAVLSAAGLLVLALGASLMSAGVALVTLASYTLVYTPLKRHTSFATVVGAVPGALPPVIGWTAAGGTLSREAWILFGIVFLWQMPHFLAIAWMYREDYARAGFPMLPVIEPDGRSTGRQAVLYSTALLPLSLAPTLAGMAGAAYFAGALALTVALLSAAVRFNRTRADADARRLFFGSILYLPALWILMIADRL